MNDKKYKEYLLKNLKYKVKLIDEMDEINEEHLEIIKDITSRLYNEIIVKRTYYIKIEEDLYNKITNENLNSFIIKNLWDLKTGDLINIKTENKYETHDYKILLAQKKPFVEEGYVFLNIRKFSWREAL